MDRSLVCRECGVTFVFTQGEQEFYQSRGLTNPPSRCPKCRAARRAQQGVVPGVPSARPPAAAPAAVGSRPLESRPMYPATCARCGQQTQVPFQPRGDRPVYCSTCFHSERTSATPSWAAMPSLAALPTTPPEEARRERRNRKADRWEREREKVPYRRSRDYLHDEDDEE